MKQPSFNIDEDLLDDLDDRLDYGDSRSEWVRDAIQLKMEIVDAIGDDMDDEERREFVLDAIESMQ